ncbi:MAG: 3-hydroxyacyl-CoA dehydrogenase family protein [bacterium]|nr:3-hydroxyacyl-CoA dehydrogenase family protein [bacterium]
MSIQKVGVIGAGTMGIGVTLDLILHGISVVLVDISTEALEKAKLEILNNIRFAPMLNKNISKSMCDRSFERIFFTGNIEDVADCGFIIENVPEKFEIKETVYFQLDKICKPGVCFGVNTSCIPVTKIAGAIKRKNNIIGMHFMNPVFLKSTIEVIKGFHTSEECIKTTTDFLMQLNKKGIIVNDSPGFVANRISHLFMNEAAFVVQDQVANPKEVDEIFKKCYGHKMGPLETADLIGLDTVVDSLLILYESYQDTKFKCCPLLKKMVHAGLLGKKVGKGFFNY